MKIKIDYIDNNIIINDDKVNVIEIENKKFFYRLIKDLNEIYNGYDNTFITCFSNSNDEIDLKTKIKIYINYFNFEFDTKKNLNDISKYVIKHIDNENKDKIINAYKKVVKNMNSQLNKIDLPLCLSNEVTIDSIVKSFKISIKESSSLLDNLLLAIDLEKTFKANNLLIFINLKQYLLIDELEEFYKYAIYNRVQIILIDSFNYGIAHEYETKLIIDDSLDEFML